VSNMDSSRVSGSMGTAGKGRKHVKSRASPRRGDEALVRAGPQYILLSLLVLPASPSTIQLHPTYFTTQGDLGPKGRGSNQRHRSSRAPQRLLTASS